MILSGSQAHCLFEYGTMAAITGATTKYKQRRLKHMASVDKAEPSTQHPS